MFILLVDHNEDYDPPEVHGPFDTEEQAAEYAERFRALNALPIKATPENNDTWTAMGWYFGIFEPYHMDREAAAAVPETTRLRQRGGEKCR